jgi:hypothetical protein
LPALSEVEGQKRPRPDTIQLHRGRGCFFQHRLRGKQFEKLARQNAKAFVGLNTEHGLGNQF